MEIAEKVSSSIHGALIDHGCYENGIYVELFSEVGIPIYFNDYPTVFLFHKQ